MPQNTLIFAVLLMALGFGAYLATGTQTALLPAYPGILLAVLSGLALVFSNARRHLMHAAAVVTLLGALAPAAALAVRAADMSPLALSINVAMLGLCAILLVLMVRSFIAARRSA
ncbi:hypothetical protein GJ672_03665 [Spiribacter sp. 2438]|uniref:hypothetical protein n=1 Tax=Spiribacter sp. 2438 TaxID=2666185 RepID=UPI0012AEF6C2|nr:hypothetical protein [Spiribacter sp. 2438]QGM21453.1 hypothetical protein GJ672_03665 [Spiribacter sp. 2438]